MTVSIIYDGFDPRRANVVDKPNLRLGHHKLANLGWFGWAVVG
jgi:hypothetical protein